MTRRGVYKMPRLALRAALSVLATGCDGSASVPAAQYDDEILVEIAVDDPDVSEVSVRAWDERHTLVLDEVRPVADYPRYVRFFAAPDDPTDSRFRWVRVEAELWNEEGCPYARAVGTYRYGAERTVTRLIVTADDRWADQTCMPLYVDGRSTAGSSQGCVRDAPCSTIPQAIEASRNAPGSVAILVAGNGMPYEGFMVRRDVWDRTLEDPHVVRAWPGRSLPDAPTVLSEQPPGEAGVVVGLCCLSSGPRGIEIDGLRIVGGNRAGLEVIGAEGIRIRNCDLSGAGDEDDMSVRRGAIRAINVQDLEVEHNHIHHNQHRDGIQGVSGLVLAFSPEQIRAGAQVRVWANRFTDNQDQGVLLEGLSGPVSFTDNTACRNGEAGIRLDANGASDAAVRFAHNAVLNNGGVGLEIAWNHVVTVEKNTAVGNVPESLALVGTPEVLLRDNVLFGTERPGNTMNPDPAPETTDCLLAPFEAGACPGFPGCEP